MKKTISVFLVAVIFMTFVGCGAKKALPQDTSCEAILKEIEQVTDMPKYEKLYLKSEGNLDALSLSLWCDGTLTSFADTQMLEDYAMFLAAGVETFEITVLKFSDTVDENTKKDIFERRKNTMASGDKGAYDPDFETMMDSAVVHMDGNFAILLITRDNDKALEAIDNLKQ